MPRGSITAAAKGLKAPPTGTPLTSHLAMAIAGLTSGAMERSKQKREEARREALLDIQRRGAEVAEEQLEISGRRADLEERRTEIAEGESSRRALSEQEAREEADRLRREQEASLPTLRNAVRLAAERAGAQLDEEQLKQANFATLNELLDHYRAVAGQELNLRITRIQRQGQERAIVLDELRRVEAAISNARMLRNTEINRLYDDPMVLNGIRQQAAQIAGQQDRNPRTIEGELIQQEIERRMSAYGESGDLTGLMNRAAELRGILQSRVSGEAPAQVQQTAGQTPGGLTSWSELGPDQQAIRAEQVKDVLRQGGQLDIDRARLAGWPVDQWIMELQAEQEQQQAQGIMGRLQQLRDYNIEGATTPDEPLPAGPGMRVPDINQFMPGGTAPAPADTLPPLLPGTGTSSPGSSPLSINDTNFRAFQNRTALRRRTPPVV